MLICKNGEPNLPISERFYPSDFSTNCALGKVDLSPDFQAQYEIGCSLSEIAHQFGCSKNRVRKSLLDAGIELRELRAHSTNERKITSGKQGARLYFGFCYLEGKIVKDPKEYPTLLLIHQRLKKSATAHEIVKELNHKKIPARQGGQWTWPAVQNILNRFKDHKIIIKGSTYEFR